jgi:hypothetical protein
MTHLQNMMLEATQFRMLRDVFRRDPTIGPESAAIMRDVFRMGGEDPVAAADRRARRRR